MTLNKRKPGTDLYRVTYTPKGTTQKKEVCVYARNRLDASNYLILHQMWGEQHSVEYATVNLMH